MNGFISRDGENPAVFLSTARKELNKYDVTVIRRKVTIARKLGSIFSVTADDGKEYFAKKLLLATGLRDKLPPLKNFMQFYGKSAFHCPYCDAWEFRDLPWVVYAAGRGGAVEVPLRLRTWTGDITVLGPGVARLSKSDTAMLRRNGIKVITEKADSLKGKSGKLEAVLLSGGTSVPARALFFSIGQEQQCDLAFMLNCECNAKGLITTNRLQQTNVPGLYVAGDTAWDMQLVIIAAAEGAKAGVAINSELNNLSRK
jgi:thioredoxin reductase